MPYLLIKLIKQPDLRFKVIHMGIMGCPLPEAEDQSKYILSVKDRFSKHVVLINMKSIESDKVINSFCTNYLSFFGCPVGTPNTIVTDDGSNFKSEMVQLFINKLGLITNMLHHTSLDQMVS